MTLANPRVCAITVTYGQRWHLVSQVLLELLKHHESIDHIVVVDNGSLEPIAQRVEESGWNSKISVVRLPENVGSAGGFAAGIERAMQSNADMFWLLDE